MASSPPNTIASYAPLGRASDGSELLPVWQDGAQRRMLLAQLVAFANEAAAGTNADTLVAAAQAAASASLASSYLATIQQFVLDLAVPYSALATKFVRLENVVMGAALPAGGDYSGTYVSLVPTIAAMAAIPAPYDGQPVQVTDPVMGGLWMWRQLDLTANVALDPTKGLYAASATIPATNGAWVRVVTDNRFLAQWWGTTTIRTDNQVPINAAMAAIPDGAALILPGYDMSVTATCLSRSDRAVHIRAAARHKSHLFVADPAASYDLLHVMGSSSSVIGIALTGGATGAAAYEPVCLTMGMGNTVVSNPGTVSDMLVEDVQILDGDSGILTFMCTTAYVPGAPTPDVANGISLDWPDIYPIQSVVVRNNKIRARKNAIAFYGAVDCEEYGNDVTIIDHDIVYFSSGLRILGGDNVYSHNSRYAYEAEKQQNAYGIYYALSAINSGAVKLANRNCRIEDHTIVNAPIPFEIESWAGGSLELRGHKVRKSLSGVVSYPIIRMQPQGPIGGQKYLRTEGFTRLHVADIDAEGGAQFIVSFVPVKDMLIKGNTWVSNAYTTTDGMTPIDIRDSLPAADANGGPFISHGPGLVRILHNEMLSASASYNEIAVQNAIATTRVIAQGNRSVASNGGGVPRAQFLLAGAAGATIMTDGVTEQAAGAAISSGLNYRYPAGARAAAVSGD
ncbi:hypothetical protein [Sphingomonas abietis]|uniref:Right-handed parallel beta-helix repeat-containing protein n=1 Tax=Sphingomonas abietis TaxID=3012344 RepID=A0ABY7NHH1_9SPHN|nr:hypothetical protein [Sphingomonas abietis]WBO20982.1 hypothetical protein PBT88_12275 [Sphingomonas abietis]